MSTKRVLTFTKDCLSKNQQNAKFCLSHQNDQFNHINLNQNQKCEDLKIFQSERNPSNKNSSALETVFVDRHERSISNSWKKNNQLKASTKLSTVSEFSKGEKNSWKNKKDSSSTTTTSSSTLSLHIAAYENAIELQSDKNDLESSKFVESNKNSFKFQRRQNDEFFGVEVMHFKATQKLWSPDKPEKAGKKERFAISRPYKVYTPEDYKSAASYYLSLDPPDLTQAAEKIWKSAADSVKLYFLRMNYQILSHKALSVLSLLACDQFVGGASLRDGFRDAEMFHKFFYGEYEFNPDDFEKHMMNVFYFVDAFPLLDRSLVQRKLETEFPQVLDTKIKNKSKELRLRRTRSSPYNQVICCGEKYYPTHMFY